MSSRGSPVFLERRRYRLRRLMDALRLLPVVGVLLWMFPLLWPSQGAATIDRVPTSQALIYIFTVWIVLIVVSAVMWYRVRSVPQNADPDPEGGD